jgi:hypothetical protein
MRFAISGISHRGGREKASDVCAFVRDCKAGQFEIPVLSEFLEKYFC